MTAELSNEEVYAVLRQKQERDEVQSEGMSAPRVWRWFRKGKSAEPTAEQIGVEQTETDDIEPRLTALQKALLRRKRSVRATWAGAGITASGLASMLIMTSMPASGLPGFWLPVGLIFGGEAVVLASILRGEMAVRAAVNALASTDDLRAVGGLVEALASGEPSYSLAVSVLCRLLPRLQPSDASLLNDDQRACLRRALKQSSSPLCFWRRDPHFANVVRRALMTLDALPPTEVTAIGELTEQTAPNADAVLVQFQAAVRQRQKNAITIGAAAVLGAASSIANIVAQMMTHQQYCLPLLGVAVGSIGITLYLTFRGLFRLKGMMNELANAGDLRVVGPLIEIAAIQDGNANTTAALLLTRLLPRLRASDAPLLTRRQHAALGRAISANSSNSDFLVALLKALEQVGDGDSLLMVENLAEGKTATADPKRVQAAARECLPFLRAHADQRRASQTLLRASNISETPIDMLLRPAQGVAAAQDAQLLRPGTPQPEGEGEVANCEFLAPYASRPVLCIITA